MDCFSLCSQRASPVRNSELQKLPTSSFSFPCSLCSKSYAPPSPTSLSKASSKVYCARGTSPPEEPRRLTTASAFTVLGVAPGCSSADLKAAFRAKVKEFHPDVSKDKGNSDEMIRHVIRAYELLSNFPQSEIIERDFTDPFEDPECEAYDLFVNEVLCAGTRCPYSCVERAPHAFEFISSTGTARAKFQGFGDDYQIQLAVGQCPRRCIHYVTPLQRVILEELLGSILEMPYDTSAEAELLYSLIVKATYENGRYQKPRKKPKASTENIDWF